MAKSRKAIIGIDVGTHSIKMARGQFADGKVQLDKVAISPLPPGSFQKYGLDAQIDSLNELIAEHKLKGEVILCLSDPAHPVQAIQLPEMPPEERREAISWELTQRKKFDPNVSEFDFVYIDQSFDQSGAKKTAMVTIRPKETINRLMDCFAKGGLTPLTIETPSFSLVQSLKTLDVLPSKRAYLILNMGAACTYVMVVNDHQLVFERKIMIGGEALTKAISDYCKLDYENAEKLKIEYGITTSVMSDKIIEATHIQTSSLEKLVSDIQYSVKYFTFQVTRSKINKFEKVLLVGGAANLPGVREFIAERLALDCVVLDLSDKVALPKGFALDEDQPKPWPSLAPALGLGFWDDQEMEQTCTSLLPESARPKTFQEATKAQIKKGMGSLAVTVSVIVGAILIGFLSLALLDNRVSTLETSIKAKKLSITNLELNLEKFKRQFIELGNRKEALLVEVQQVKSKIFAIESYRRISGSPASAIDELSDIVPEGIKILRVLMDDSELRVTGLANKNEKIAGLMKGINDHESFARCRFQYTREKQEKDRAPIIEFELQADRE